MKIFISGVPKAYVVKKTKNKKFFFIFFQQCSIREKKCIFASLLKDSMWWGVTRQTFFCKVLNERKMP